MWPPTGIALAALVLCGGCAAGRGGLGALLANGWTGVPIETVLGITVDNPLGALAGAYLLVFPIEAFFSDPSGRLHRDWAEQAAA